MEKLYNMKLTQTYICQSIYELLDPNKTNNYAFKVNLNWYEKDDLLDSISLIPKAPIIYGEGGEYNITRFKFDVTVQVFQRYLNKDSQPSEWTRWEEYLEILDLFLNKQGQIPFFEVQDISERGVSQHRTGKGTIYEFDMSGVARLINETTIEELEKGGNC